jgi:hypothetical protein
VNSIEIINVYFINPLSACLRRPDAELPLIKLTSVKKRTTLMHPRNSVLVPAIVLACTVALTGSIARAFTPGDIVLMRGGDPSHSQSTFSSGEVPAYLDEYTPAGVLVGSTPIDSAVLTLPGVLVNSHEGRLNLSGNGQFLDFAGYQQATSTNQHLRANDLRSLQARRLAT